MRLTRDLLAGLMFCTFGIGAVIVAHDYGFGTPARMGPGFFPTVVGALVAAMGLVLVVRSVLNPETGEPVEAIHFRPLFFISAAIVSFGILIEERGLVVALVALIVIARFAGREGGIMEVATMVFVLIGVSVGIFIYGLNIYLRLWI